ncbi:MAG: hypothetical protein R3F43_07460 [bacterium]
MGGLRRRGNRGKMIKKLAWLCLLTACDDGASAVRDAVVADATPADVGVDARPAVDAAPPSDASVEADAVVPTDLGVPDAALPGRVGGGGHPRRRAHRGHPRPAGRAGCLHAHRRRRPGAPDAGAPARRDPVIIASHPEARIRGFIAYADEVPPARIALTRFSTADNPAYSFQDPGTPALRENTSKCGHCHLTLNDDWYASPTAPRPATRRSTTCTRGRPADGWRPTPARRWAGASGPGRCPAAETGCAAWWPTAWPTAATAPTATPPASTGGSGGGP